MSNQLVLGNSNLPARLQNRELSANTLALAGNGSPTKRISIEGSVFRMIVDGKEVMRTKNREMNIVVVRTAPANSRIYYDPNVAYQRGQSAPPLCSSADGVRPDARVKTPQASSCDKCPQNIAGSGNGDSRACRYQRRLAVVLEGDLSGDVYQLALSATSIFGRGAGGTRELPLEAYARMLASNKVNVEDVVTTMEFDTDSSTPKLVFSPARYLTDEEAAIVLEQGNRPEAEQATGVSPYALDVANAAPVAPPAPQPKPVAQPVAAPLGGFEWAKFEAVDGDVDAPPAEPKPVRARTRAAAPDVAVVADDDGVPEPVKADTEMVSQSRKIESVLAEWK